ncbi:MAG: hypothetical protein ACRDYY_09735 [Acidimicrobiales bacterium]
MERSTSPSCNARSYTGDDFRDLDQIGERLAAFEDRYNATAQPFDWRFTQADLDELCRRIDAHRPRESALVA